MVEKIPPQAGIELGTPRSVGQRLIHRGSCSNDGSQHMFKCCSMENFPLIIPVTPSYLKYSNLPLAAFTSCANR